MAERRFPAPWSVEETDACFIVRDSTVEHSKPFAKSGENPEGGFNSPERVKDEGSVYPEPSVGAMLCDCW